MANEKEVKMNPIGEPVFKSMIGMKTHLGEIKAGTHFIGCLKCNGYFNIDNCENCGSGIFIIGLNPDGIPGLFCKQCNRGFTSFPCQCGCTNPINGTTLLVRGAEGGCFIASAAYGSPVDSNVEELRSIRDNVLRQTESGESFFQRYWERYYRISPIIVKEMEEDAEVRELVRWSFVEPLVNYLRFSRKLLLLDEKMSKEEVINICRDYRKELCEWLENMPFVNQKSIDKSIVDEVIDILKNSKRIN